MPAVLSTARGRRPRAVLKTKGTVFPIRTSRPVNNINIDMYISLKVYLTSVLSTLKEQLCAGLGLRFTIMMTSPAIFFLFNRT